MCFDCPIDALYNWSVALGSSISSACSVSFKTVLAWALARPLEA
jgi:hypothetical protein